MRRECELRTVNENGEKRYTNINIKHALSCLHIQMNERTMRHSLTFSLFYFLFPWLSRIQVEAVESFLEAFFLHSLQTSKTLTTTTAAAMKWRKFKNILILDIVDRVLVEFTYIQVIQLLSFLAFPSESSLSSTQPQHHQQSIKNENQFKFMQFNFIGNFLRGKKIQLKSFNQRLTW